MRFVRHSKVDDWLVISHWGEIRCPPTGPPALLASSQPNLALFLTLPVPPHLHVHLLYFLLLSLSLSLLLLLSHLVKYVLCNDVFSLTRIFYFFLSFLLSLTHKIWCQKEKRIYIHRKIQIYTSYSNEREKTVKKLARSSNILNIKIIYSGFIPRGQKPYNTVFFLLSFFKELPLIWTII